MDEQHILQKLEEQEKKLEAIYRSVEKTRKYFFWTMVITLVVVVVPGIGLLFVVPAFLNNYVEGIQRIGGL